MSPLQWSLCSLGNIWAKWSLMTITENGNDQSEAGMEREEPAQESRRRHLWLPIKKKKNTTFNLKLLLKIDTMTLRADFWMLPIVWAAHSNTSECTLAARDPALHSHPHTSCSPLEAFINATWSWGRWRKQQCGGTLWFWKRGGCDTLTLKT